MTTTVQERRAPSISRSDDTLNKALTQLFAPASAGTTELLLIRHAQPDYLALAEDDDSTDPPLTPVGRCQAMRLAMRLHKLQLDALYASTMRRALETAAFIAADQDLTIERSDALREIRFDPTFAQSQYANGGVSADLARRFISTPSWDALPGFEPSRGFRHRVIQELEAIAARHEGERVAIVAHGGVINAYLSMVLGIQRDVFYLPNHASISSLRIHGDLYAVRSMNDAAHLPPELQSC
jgi:broad specificity phosphatase PhoE